MFAWMKEILDKLLAVVLSLLPLSPFKEFIGYPLFGIFELFYPGGYLLEDWCGMAFCYRTLLSVQRCGTLDKTDRVRWCCDLSIFWYARLRKKPACGENNLLVGSCRESLYL